MLLHLFHCLPWLFLSVTSRTRRRCWGVQHIGNIVANLYQGRDKNGFGSLVYLAVMMMKIMTRIIRWVMDKSQEDHVSNICILMINTMAILMSCGFILCWIHVWSSEDAYSRCLRVAHVYREHQCTGEMIWWRDRLGAFKTHQTIMAQVTSYLNDYKTHATSENQEVWPHLVWCEEWNHTPKVTMVCSRYSGGLIDPWIMLFSLFWPGGMQMKVTREPLNNSRISCFGSCTFICFSSPNYFTAKTQVLDHGQRRRLRRARKPGHQLTVAAGGAERCKDLFSLFRILQKEIMSGMYSRSLCCGRLKNQRIRTEIEWRLQVFGVFWMHCCELQVHSLTTNRVAEHGDSWALILFFLLQMGKSTRRSDITLTWFHSCCFIL